MKLLENYIIIKPNLGCVLPENAPYLLYGSEENHTAACDVLSELRRLVRAQEAEHVYMDLEFHAFHASLMKPFLFSLLNIVVACISFNLF